ncbi:hypothetical protein [Salibaculum griseiflavum]|uniref:hypothetical protein n=1 Tax=Salibaculum griseiflavum TaxID=1914409 RepID=UPI0011B27194|nr:hypothetical protein [Salibaculum griseiflavum]
MQPLIHKASVKLTADKLPKSASPGDAVNLYLQEDGKIVATYMVPSRLPFGLGRPAELALGYLGQQATEILRPALQRYAHLRVRIVEIEPAHLRSSGKTSLFISVWGDPAILQSARPRHQIFTPSKINDDPAPEGDD